MTSISTTFIVYENTRCTVDDPDNPSEYHWHIYLGPRIDHGIRDIYISQDHICEFCPGNFFVGMRLQLNELPNYFPVNVVSDWNDEEAEILSLAFCPLTNAQTDINNASVNFLAGFNYFYFLTQLQSTFSNNVQSEGEEEEEQIPDSFPPEIQAEPICPACLSDEQSLLHLGCRHSICDSCLRQLLSKKCPVCREPIKFSLIRKSSKTQ
jgi:hypothetical protein